MEGVAGVFSFDDTFPDGRFYSLSRHLLTQEVNVAIEGALELGATEILVVDGHGQGGVNIEELNSEAKLLAGRPLFFPAGLDDTFDAVFAIGQHAMAGVEQALLSHTISHTSIQNIWVNGKKVGEFEIFAAVAGLYEVPTVLVTGDKAACVEAMSIIPQVEAVALKEGVSHEAAISLSPIKARQLIKNGAKKALTKINEIKPYKLQSPIELTIEFTESFKKSAETLSSKPYVKKVDARTVRIEGSDLVEVLHKWLF